MLAVADEHYLYALEFHDRARLDAVLAALVREISPGHNLAEGDSDLLRRVRLQVGEYFAGERTRFDLPVRPRGTDFQRRAWAALADIPFGQTWTYGQQAAHIGRPTAVRAVAGANSRNTLPLIYPCHRVVAAGGALGGYAGGVARKRWLLEHEAAVIAGGASEKPSAPLFARHHPS